MNANRPVSGSFAAGRTVGRDDTASASVSVSVSVPESLIEQARSIARAAGALTLEWFGARDLAVDFKPDGSEVTEADRAAEHLVRDALAARFPDDAVYGEEHGVTVGRTGRTWIVDPIDGTRGFVRGVPLYATLLALVDDDGPLVGVIDLPALGMTVCAGRAAGCWLGDSRCSVSDRGALSGALVNTSSYETFDPAQFAAFVEAGAMLRTWGDAYGYALVATGRAEAMIDPVCETWDLAPMPVILAEAGGRFTDLAGRSDYRNRCGVATNGHCHDDVLAAMRQSRRGSQTTGRPDAAAGRTA